MGIPNSHAFAGATALAWLAATACIASPRGAAAPPAQQTTVPPAPTATPPRVPMATPTPAPTLPVESLHSSTEPVRLVTSIPPAQSSFRHGQIDVAAWHFETGPSPRAQKKPRTLSETRQAWVHFLGQVHDRVHPLFADQYLRSLDALPASEPFNDKTLVVNVGFAVEQSTGELAAAYIVHASGNEEFDIAALAAFRAAFPMPVPAELASGDGRAYFEWEIHRSPEACSTYNARPYRFNPEP